MLKKFTLATATAAIALYHPAAFAVPAPEVEAVDATAVVEVEPEDTPDSMRNPFTGMENFALKKPLIDLPAPDPARLAVAEQVLGTLLADGTYAHAMKSMQKETLQPLLDRVWNMKGGEFAALFGITDIPESDKNQSFAEAFAKDDPYGKQRFEAYMTAYFDLIGDAAGAIEPDIRGAMARDFARRYDLAQLKEMNRFFSTPAGSAFARDYMTSSSTLDVLQTTLMVWPKMMKKVPDFTQRLMKADAHLPPKPKPKYETDDMAAAVDAAADAAASAAMDASCYNDEPWCDHENWAAGDRKAYDKASAAYSKASSASDSAYSKMNEAEAKAVEAARKKYEADGWKPESEPAADAETSESAADAPHEAHEHD